MLGSHPLAAPIVVPAVAAGVAMLDPDHDGTLDASEMPSPVVRQLAKMVEWRLSLG